MAAVWQARRGGLRCVVVRLVEASYGEVRQARRGMSGRGKVWYGKAWLGLAGKVGQGKARQGVVGYGRQGRVRHGEESRGMARLGRP